MDGFKPCPACGENAFVRRYEDGCCFIVCLSCNMRGPGESNMIAAKYAWNSLPRRHESPPTLWTAPDAQIGNGKGNFASHLRSEHHVIIA